MVENSNVLIQVLMSEYPGAPINELSRFKKSKETTKFGIQHVRFDGDEKPHHKPKEGTNYHGQPKGLRQLLWELGLWKDNMKRSIPEGQPQELSMEHVSRYAF